MSDIISCLNCRQKNRVNKSADSSKVVCAKCRAKLIPQSQTAQPPSPTEFTSTTSKVLNDIISCPNCRQKNRVNKSADSSKVVCAKCRAKLNPQSQTVQPPSPTDFTAMTLNVGYVYVLFNQSMPNYVKIGMTTRSVNERAKELSKTGVPGKWEVYFSIFVPSCEQVEKLVHKHLKKVRYSSNREFFNISLVKAEHAVTMKANENISKYPGWPDPKSVQNHLDKVELENRKEIEEQRLRIEYREREREKERKEAEQKLLIRRKDSADSYTKEILAKGPLGSGSIFLIVFFLALGGNGNPEIKLIAVIFIIISGMKFRKDDKIEAAKTRKKWGLPPV